MSGPATIRWKKTRTAQENHNMASSARLLTNLIGAMLLLDLAGCAATFQQHVLYDQGGVHIGLEPDRSNSKTSPSTWNTHPVQFTTEQVYQLLSHVLVSGYSGTLAGLIVEPRPMPVLSQEELDLITAPIVEAFQRAGPRERVFFSIPDLRARYRRERTEGELFFRTPHLFILLKDHSSFINTDTGGSDDERDPRDHKGMQLSAVFPLQASDVTLEDGPKWGPYEQVHLAINVQEAMTALASSIPTLPVQQPRQSPQPALHDIIDDLRLQVRELTNANQDLRKKLAEQTAEMDALKKALARILQDANQTKPKGGSGQRIPPP
jgi:hypothetical protein